MKIELYEKYKLKDGRTGWAVDILGHGEASVFELDKKGIEDRIITVTQEEVDEKISEQRWNRFSYRGIKCICGGNMQVEELVREIYDFKGSEKEWMEF